MTTIVAARREIDVNKLETASVCKQRLFVGIGAATAAGKKALKNV